MSRDARYVFDTNVIVSALLFGESVPGKAFFSGVEKGTVLLSAELAKQLWNVLGRKKFDRYLTRDERERLFVGLIRHAQIMPTTTRIHDCRDPDDNAVLELAVDGNASCVVTGDNDLLTLHPFRAIPILTPARFLEWLAGRTN